MLRTLFLENLRVSKQTMLPTIAKVNQCWMQVASGGPVIHGAARVGWGAHRYVVGPWAWDLHRLAVPQSLQLLQPCLIASHAHQVCMLPLQEVRLQRYDGLRTSEVALRLPVNSAGRLNPYKHKPC